MNMKTSILVLICSLTGCVHSYQIAPIQVASLQSKHLRESKVALVLGPPAVEDTYVSKPGAQTITFSNVSQSLRSAFEQKFKAAVGQWQVIAPGENTSEFDIVIIPTLSVRVVNDYWTLGSLIEFTVDVKNNAGVVTGHATAKFKKSFSGFNFKPDTAFNEALTAIFDKVVNEALSNK